MAAKQITMIASSPNGDKSKSNAALGYAYESLSSIYAAADEPAAIDIIDTHSILQGDRELSSKSTLEIISQIRHSDALVIASPIYNWTISDQLMSFMNRVISSDESKEYQLCMFLGGASSKLSLFAFEGLARSLSTETNAIIVGSPILVLKDDLHYNSKGLIVNISDSLKKRIDSHLHVIHRLLQAK